MHGVGNIAAAVQHIDIKGRETAILLLQNFESGKTHVNQNKSLVLIIHHNRHIDREHPVLRINILINRCHLGLLAFLYFLIIIAFLVGCVVGFHLPVFRIIPGNVHRIVVYPFYEPIRLKINTNAEKILITVYCGIQRVNQGILCRILTLCENRILHLRLENGGTHCRSLDGVSITIHYRPNIVRSLGIRFIRSGNTIFNGFRNSFRINQNIIYIIHGHVCLIHHIAINHFVYVVLAIMNQDYTIKQKCQSGYES